MKYIKLILVILGVVLLIWFLLPFVFQGILNAGNIFGVLLGILLTLFGAYISQIFKFLRVISRTFYAKILLFLIALIVFSALVTVAFFSMKIISFSKKEINPNSTAVVLGCRVREDGPSLMLSERIDAAYEFLCKVPDAKMILSGGKGDDEPISEARCMYNYLVDKGIEPSRLYLEEHSTSTEENIRFSKEIIKNERLDENVTLITNDFHQYRATIHANNIGLNVTNYSADTNLIYLPTYFLRELCGILHFYILGG